MDSLFTSIKFKQQVTLPLQNVQKDNSDKILNILRDLEGKCCKHGYIEPESIKVDSYSSGRLFGNQVIFDVVVYCRVVLVAADSMYTVKVKNITKAGAKCEFDMNKSPAIIFIARDHHYNDKTFGELKEGQLIQIKVIGQRYELNDEYISILAEYISEHKE